jgi:rfaE bifunctional protein kinase chain/domain
MENLILNGNWADKLSDIKVLVVGDIMIDRYITGKVDRISPEAPVPVITHDKTEDRLGGAANVALNVQALGAQAFICSLAGEDTSGFELLELVKAQGMKSDFIRLSDERRTTVKTRVIGNNQHLLRVDREDTHFLSEVESDLLLTRFDKALNEVKPHILVLQDYNKGLLSPQVIGHCIEMAKKQKVFVAVDPKQYHFFEYKGVDLFKPNLKEISSAFQIEASSDFRTLQAISRELRGRIQNRYTLITLSHEGLYIEDSDHAFIIPPHRRRNIVDVCGAGDTVLSIASIFLFMGMDIEWVGRAATTAVGQVCERAGVVPVDKNLLFKELTKA